MSTSLKHYNIPIIIFVNEIVTTYCAQLGCQLVVVVEFHVMIGRLRPQKDVKESIPAKTLPG